jgi:hypothetical protein
MQKGYLCDTKRLSDMQKVEHSVMVSESLLEQYGALEFLFKGLLRALPNDELSERQLSTKQFTYNSFYTTECLIIASALLTDEEAERFYSYRPRFGN